MLNKNKLQKIKKNINLSTIIIIHFIFYFILLTTFKFNFIKIYFLCYIIMNVLNYAIIHQNKNLYFMK